MSQLLRIFEGLLSNDISKLFAALIVFYFVVAFLALLWPGHRQRVFADLAPTILTTLGILGTFTGIFIGLLDFDIKAISRSIPDLIEGLKVAFSTSILGLASALIFKIIRAIFNSRASSDEITSQDLIDALNDISLQVKELRETNKAGFEEQIKEFKAFAENMSKAFSDAIIEELKLVIREFNEKLSEQFGENFKQLNVAVGELLNWQENYKTQMEALRQSLDKSIESIGASENSLVEIEKAASLIPDHMTKLSEANETLVNHLTLMHDGLSSIAEMKKNAENAIPEIAEKIDEMTTTISSSVESQKEVIDTLKAELENTVRSISGELESSHKQMVDGFQNALNQSLQTATKHLNDAVVQLDEAMQREIENVMRTMAENLSGIAQKFVKDYQPLLDTTRQIVELGARARDE